MIGKVAVKSYKAVSSRQVKRLCPKCKRREQAEEVDYGEGGKLLFFACGHVRDPKNKE